MRGEEGDLYDELLGDPGKGELVQIAIYSAIVFGGMTVVIGLGSGKLLPTQVGMGVLLVVGSWWLPRLIRIRVRVDRNRQAAVKRLGVFLPAVVVPVEVVDTIRMVRSPRGLRGELATSDQRKYDLGSMRSHYAPVLEARLRLLAKVLEVELVERGED